jgi:DUF1680 family protein
MSDGNNRREFIKKGLFAAAAAPFMVRSVQNPAPAQAGEPPSEPKRFLEPFNYDGVRLLDGMLRKQYLATRDWYFGLPDDDILKGFRRRAGLPTPGNDMGAWGKADTSEVFGQWLSGMARMYKATGDVAMRDKAVYLMREWAKTIEPDGTPYYPLGNTKELRDSHYAWDKQVYGLVDLYEYCGEKEALPPLEKITDWAVKSLDRTRKPPVGFDLAGVSWEWYTLCENLYRAYQLTGNSKYKTFGDLWRYNHYWGMFTGKVPLNVKDFHAYSHVNTLSSAAMTYAVTGEPEYLKTLVNAYDYFQDVQCYATGGYGPAERLVASDGGLGRSLESEANTFETPCGSWAVFKLGRYLMQFTGEARFGDWTEKLVYNGIGAALPMAPGGKTFYYADYRLGSAYPIGSARKVYYWDPYPCCSGTYIQAVADYHNLIYFKGDAALYVNMFVPSAVTWNLDGQEIQVEQETAYPESDRTTLTVRPKKSVAFNLRFRVPGWSRGATVEVNGSKLEVAARPGTWGTVQRTWKPGDRVTIQIPMRLRLVPIDRQHPRRVALTYGPVVLVQDGRYTRELNRLPAGPDLSKAIIPTGKPLEFRVAGGQAKEVYAPSWGTYMPFYQLGQGIPYRMYIDLVA